MKDFLEFSFRTLLILCILCGGLAQAQEQKVWQESIDTGKEALAAGDHPAAERQFRKATHEATLLEKLIEELL